MGLFLTRYMVLPISIDCYNALDYRIWMIDNPLSLISYEDYCNFEDAIQNTSLY
jgi:hypothetical protein